MIDVVLYYKNDNRPRVQISEDQVDVHGSIVGFELKGHAGYADHGEDIVCASISVLSLHTANALSDLSSNDVDVIMKEDGYLKVMVREDLDETGVVLMKAFYLSVESIYEDYKDAYDKNEFINIKFKEV